MKKTANEFTWAIKRLNKILEKATLSKDLRDAISEIKTAIEAGDLTLAADISAVKSLVSGMIGETFSEDQGHNVNVLGHSVYSILDEIHSSLAIKTGTMPSGMTILSAKGKQERQESNIDNPILKKMNAEWDKIRKAAENKWAQEKKAIPSEAKEKWEEFGKIPIDDDGYILEPFEDFPIGTDREDIWMWFEEKYNLSVAELMGLKK